MRAGIYARISDDREDTQAGVGRQVQDCEALGHTRAWNIVDRYVDNDISAYRPGSVRHEYRRMLQDIRDKQIDAVIVYHQDRLWRQPREIEEFFDVCDLAGLKDLASVTGDADLSTADGRMKVRILGAVARNQSDAAARRIRRKHLELAIAGKVSGGGDRPYGFEPDRVTVRPDEAEIIRELAGRFIAGESLRSLVADLNTRGIPAVRGPWRSASLKRMLASARISGQREHHKEIVSAAVWPAIINPAQTIRIRAILADPARRATRAPQSYLLKGLLRCWKCNTPLVARPKEDGRRRYVCATGPNFTGCGGASVLGEPVEEFVTEAVLSQLDAPQLLRAVRQKPVNDPGAWHTKAAALERRLDELAETYAAGSISMREWLAAREPMQRQLDDTRRRVAREGSVTILAEYAGRSEQLRADWEAMTLERRRALIAAALHHVIVLPGRRGFNKFQPERFQLVWRH